MNHQRIKVEYLLKKVILVANDNEECFFRCQAFNFKIGDSCLKCSRCRRRYVCHPRRMVAHPCSGKLCQSQKVPLKQGIKDKLAKVELFSNWNFQELIIYCV